MPFTLNIHRIINYGSLNLWRNRWLSVTAVTVMAITLLIVSGLLVLNELAGIASQLLRSQVDVSVFFNYDVSPQKIMEARKEFEGLDEVKSVKYISSEEALATFKELNKNNPGIFESLKYFEKSPLPASLVLTAKELNLYPLVYEKLQRSRFLPLIKKINYTDSKNLIARLDRITAGMRAFGLIMVAVFGFVAALVVFTTLRLTIYSRREEIEIMRLVGASNWYIRGPFLYEGVFYGLAATLLASSLLYPLLRLAGPSLSDFFKFNVTSSGFFGREFWQLIALQAVAGVALGVVSSLVATRKHLHV